jgi:hypothetical protein
MRFEQRLREGIHDGSVTVTFRRWKRRQVVPGGRYRTGTGMVVVDSVDVVDPATIDAGDARRAGYETVAELVSDLRGAQDAQVFRVALHPLAEPEPEPPEPPLPTTPARLNPRYPPETPRYPPGTPRSRQNSLPSGSARVTHPVLSGRR